MFRHSFSKPNEEYFQISLNIFIDIVNPLPPPPSYSEDPLSFKRPPLPFPLILHNQINKWWTVLINHDCNTSCKLIQYVWFKCWKFKFVFVLQLHDLFFLPTVHSLWRTRTRLQWHSVLLSLEIRSRNEDVINSTQNRIYLLNVFYFLL